MWKKSEGNTQKTRKETLKKIGRKLFVEKARRKHPKNEQGNSIMRKETLTPQSQSELLSYLLKHKSHLLTARTKLILFLETNIQIQMFGLTS